MNIPFQPITPGSPNGNGHRAESEKAYPSFDFRLWNDERIAVYATLDAALSKALVEAVKALDEMKRTVEGDARGVMERLQTERGALDSEISALRVERTKLLETLAELRAQVETEKARQIAASREVETMLATATAERDRIQGDAERVSRQMDQMGQQLQTAFQQRFNEMWAAFSKSMIETDVPPPPVTPPLVAEITAPKGNVVTFPAPEIAPETETAPIVSTIQHETGSAPTETQDPVMEWLISNETPTGDDIEPFDSLPYQTSGDSLVNHIPRDTVLNARTDNPTLAEFNELPTVRAPENYDEPVKIDDGWDKLAAQEADASRDGDKPAEIILKESAEEEQKLAAELAQAVQEGQAVGAPPKPEKDEPGVTHMRVENDFGTPEVAPAPKVESDLIERQDHPQTQFQPKVAPAWLPKNFNLTIPDEEPKVPQRTTARLSQPTVPESTVVVTSEVTITELQGFSLLAVERRMRSLPGVRKVTVTDFRRGELSLSVQHMADLHLETLLPTIPDLNLRLVSRNDTQLRFAQKQQS